MAQSYVHGANAAPLIGETVGGLLDRVAETHGEREAVISVAQATRFTYAGLRDACDRLARGLIALGVGHGDRVAIWSTNSAQWVVTQFATAKIGAVLVNLNPAYRTSELEYALAQSGTNVLISQVRFKSSEFLRMIAEVRSALPQLREVVAIDGDGELAGDYRTWEALDALADDTPLDVLRERQERTQFDEPINLQYTSGTTGFPKGATLSHHNIVNNGFFIGEACGYTPADRVCIPVPFYHCFGMVLGNLAVVTHGAAIVIPGASFDPEATLGAVQAERCTSLYGVPTMFIAELALPNFASFDLSSLRTGIMAGSPCPVEVMKRVRTEMHMPEVTICYGMTETSPVSFQTSVDDPLEKRVSSVGRVHPHVEVKIVDERGAIVPRGMPGELCTRGYSVMLGYWNDPEQTAAAIDAARYMHTGDIAVMDEDGYVNIAGRVKDMIIRGGENVYPREIEEFLYTHPEIVDVSAIGVPDEKYGEELCVWVIAREGARLDEESVRAYCRGKIAHFKVPRYVMLVDSFPMTVTGKIQKFKMREASIERLGLQAAAGVSTA